MPPAANRFPPSLIYQKRSHAWDVQLAGLASGTTDGRRAGFAPANSKSNNYY